MGSKLPTCLRQPLPSGYFALFLAISSIGCTGKGAEPHLIGHLAPLSGPNRERGLQALRGTQLAVEEANADMTRWVANRKIAVVHADTADDPKLIGHQAVRLLAVNKVSALLGGVTREQSDQLAPIAQEYGAILVGTSGSIGAPPADSACSLGLGPQDAARAADLFLGETLKLTKLAIFIESDHKSAATTALEFETLWAKRKLPLQRAPSAKIETSNNSDVVKSATVFFGSLKGARAFRERQRESGAEDLPTFLYVADDDGDPALPEVAGRDPGFHWLASWTLAAPEAEGFRARFRDRFDTAPTVDTVKAYESARFLFLAAAEAKSFAAAKLRPKLLTVSLADGSTGSVALSARQTARMPAYILHVAGGQVQVRSRIDPAPAP